MKFLASLSLIAAALVEARPLVSRSTSTLKSRELKNTLSEVTIHESCSVPERRQLTRALADTVELVSVARDYVIDHGHNNSVYQTYFGAAEPFAVVGAFEWMLSGDKTGVLLRCDDIDRNCATQVGYNGHWRGENATLETVICPLSYESRLYNEKFCYGNYTVAASPLNTFFSTDLVHRFFHIPTIGNDLVTHHADSYEECLHLAKEDPSKAPFNTHSLQYFAADVYARTVAKPGEGCTGTPVEEHDDHDHGASSSMTSAVATSSATSAAAQPVTPTSSAAQSCHTHSDGEIHCE